MYPHIDFAHSPSTGRNAAPCRAAVRPLEEHRRGEETLPWWRRGMKELNLAVSVTSPSHPPLSQAASYQVLVN